MIVEQIDSRKIRYGPEEAIQLVRQVDHLWVAKGRSSKYFNLKKDKPCDEELLAVMLGRSGTLRAPTIRRGKKLFVGFNQQEYETRLTR